MPSILYPPLTIGCTVICDQNVSIVKFTLQPGEGRHQYGEMLEYNNALIDLMSPLRVGNTLVVLFFISNRKHLSNYPGAKTARPVYVIIGNLYVKLR
jgi:hypothetical protein